MVFAFELAFNPFRDRVCATEFETGRLSTRFRVLRPSVFTSRCRRPSSPAADLNLRKAEDSCRVRRLPNTNFELYQPAPGRTPLPPCWSPSWTAFSGQSSPRTSEPRCCGVHGRRGGFRGVQRRLQRHSGHPGLRGLGRPCQTQAGGPLFDPDLVDLTGAGSEELRGQRHFHQVQGCHEELRLSSSRSSSLPGRRFKGRKALFAVRATSGISPTTAD